MLSQGHHVHVRDAEVPDASSLSELFATSWRDTYRGIIPPVHLDTMIRRRNQAWWHRALRSHDSILALEVCGVLAGYATFGLSRAAGPFKGEIYEIYIEPAHQGLGFGEFLFEACRVRLDERQLPGLIVWALSANTQATDFYWRRGGRPMTRSFDRIGGARLEKLAFTWD